MKQALLFTGKKLLRAALLLLGVSLAAFLLLCASPLDPVQTNVGQVALGSMSPEQVANLEAYWGVDQPPAQRPSGTWGGFPASSTGTLAPPCCTGSRCSPSSASGWAAPCGCC